jgi:hypothetical protein
MRTNRHFLDEDSASRLLQGTVHPDDAPPGYGAVAGLLHSAAQLPMVPVDEDAATATVSAMVEVIRDATPAPHISRRKAMLGKLLAGKALAAVAVIGLTASGAAAATGTLPDQAQSVVSDAVSHVGINIPHPNHGNSASHRKDGKHDDSNDDQGQPGDDQGQPADTDNHGSLVSDTAHSVDGPHKGPAVCEVASAGKCKAGDEHGQSSGSDDQGTPPAEPGGERGKSGDEHPTADDGATTPTTGSIATGEEHSGKDELPVGSGKPE